GAAAADGHRARVGGRRLAPGGHRGCAAHADDDRGHAPAGRRATHPDPGGVPGAPAHRGPGLISTPSIDSIEKTDSTYVGLLDSVTAMSNSRQMELASTPLLPEGFQVPTSRWENPSKRLRQLQLTMAVGDPDKGDKPRHLHIPPVVVDMDVGYGNIFNVQRTTELYVNAGVAAAHIEDQVMPKRCGHIAGKALVPADEMVAKLQMMRAVANDLGADDFVVIARTDGVSASDAPESARGLQLAIDRGLRYLDSGIPDLLWCEFPTAARSETEKFHAEIR